MAYPVLVIKNEAYPDELKKGEVIIYRRKDNTEGLILCCPKCGYTATGTHEYDNETQTLKPSIKCGGCYFHGHLKNGIFTDA